MKSAGKSSTFPAGAMGLDSWASVQLVHRDSSKDSASWTDELALAWGSCKCRHTEGKKGIPLCEVEKVQGADNIDLLPLGVLGKRGCSYQMIEGDFEFKTPLGRKIPVFKWGTLPYLDARGVADLFQDLPRSTSKDREAINTCCGLRAARSTPVCFIKEDLAHLRGDFEKPDLLRLTDRYRAMPEKYFLDASGSSMPAAHFRPSRENHDDFASTLRGLVFGSWGPFSGLRTRNGAKSISKMGPRASGDLPGPQILAA